uniref:Phosducin n=2 Tax=Paramormyrops kingsleyae TaxID=1676925 RepID=A0A3B3RZ54_9TELE
MEPLRRHLSTTAPPAKGGNPHSHKEMSGLALVEDELSASHTGPKGVINDWRKFKLESLDRDAQPSSKHELLRQMSSPHRSKEKLNRKVSGDTRGVYQYAYFTVLVFSRTRLTSSSIVEVQFQCSRTEIQRKVKIPRCYSCSAPNFNDASVASLPMRITP